MSLIMKVGLKSFRNHRTAQPEAASSGFPAETRVRQLKDERVDMLSSQTLTVPILTFPIIWSPPVYVGGVLPLHFVCFGGFLCFLFCRWNQRQRVWSASRFSALCWETKESNRIRLKPMKKELMPTRPACQLKMSHRTVAVERRIYF